MKSDDFLKIEESERRIAVSESPCCAAEGASRRDLCSFRAAGAKRSENALVRRAALSRFPARGMLLSEHGLLRGSDQATKGVWWMPWGEAPMKDANSGDTPRGAATARRSEGFRMGQPVRRNGRTPRAEHIGFQEGTRGTETS